ncbi:MAG: maleylpyruvate isomerase family mycothiol-dependent enzyme [Geodermatophilaceae bacterium]|jgi:maleylpyruvate isomerase|nr:maleylpyruvate isomerase family mycothiol-dependent enzyme [Geodermatophilaceae bacterium]
MSDPAESVPAESAHVLDWLREGEARFLGQVEGLTEDELREPSALPDWSRAHVAAHVARNAEAVSRLLSWARTGNETLMYPDIETRNRDIDTAARQGADQLRADVRNTAERFDAEVVGLPGPAWTARVRTFQGRDIPASATLWLRTREVWLHLVDLGSGVSVESWPGDLVDALLEDVTTTMNGRDDAPSWVLQATDRERIWQIGSGASDDLTYREVSGRAADLLAWLTGRSTGEGLATEGILPKPPPWM